MSGVQLSVPHPTPVMGGRYAALSFSFQTEQPFTHMALSAETGLGGAPSVEQQQLGLFECCLVAEIRCVLARISALVRFYFVPPRCVRYKQEGQDGHAVPQVPEIWP